MMPAANQGVGMNMGFPDVCLTPAAPAPIPIPYPNIGMNAMAMPFVPNVLLSFAPAQNMSAKPMLTNGDNAGVAHPLCMQPGGTTLGKPNLLVGGMPAAHLTNPTYGNNFNNPVGAKLVPSVTNVLMGCTATLSRAQRGSAARLMRDATGAIRPLDGGVLLLRLPCIGLRTERWLGDALRRFRGATLRGLVVDLRGNPGGAVPIAARLASLLQRLDVGLALAIDRRTASAAELLAALLVGRAGVRTFGERTLGKGRGRVFDLHADDLTEGATGATFGFEAVGFEAIGGPTIDGTGIRPDFACAPARATLEAAHWLRHAGSALR